MTEQLVPMRTLDEIEHQILAHPTNRRILHQAMVAAEMAAGGRAERGRCRKLYQYAQDMLHRTYLPIGHPGRHMNVPSRHTGFSKIRR